MAKPRRAVAVGRTIVNPDPAVGYRKKSRALISRADVQVQAPPITSSPARSDFPVRSGRGSSLAVGWANSGETGSKQGGNNWAASGADHRPPGRPPRPADRFDCSYPRVFFTKKGMPLCLSPIDFELRASRWAVCRERGPRPCTRGHGAYDHWLVRRVVRPLERHHRRVRCAARRG